MNTLCERTQAWLEAVQSEQELPADVDTLQAHLQSCERCQAWQQASQRLDLAVERYTEQALREGAVARVRARLEPEFRRQSERLATPQRLSWFDWRWLSGLGVAAAAAAAALMLYLPMLREGREPVAGWVLLREGQVAVRQGAGTSAAHQEERMLSSGDTIETSDHSDMVLALASDRVALAGNTRVQLQKLTRREVVLQLKSGTVVIDADPKAHQRRLRIEAEFGEVVVQGTLLSVSHAQGGSVSVTHGQVEVRLHDGSRPMRVGAGERLRREGSRFIVEPALTPLVMPWTPAPDVTAPVEALGWLVVTSEPVAAQFEINGQPVGLTPLYVRWPAGHVSYRAVLEGQSDSGELEVIAGQGTHLTLQLSQPSAAEPDTHVTARSALSSRLGKLRTDAAAPDCRTLAERNMRLNQTAQASRWVEAAECYLAERQERQALKLYQRLTKELPRTESAANAWFEIGRLSESLGNASEARAAFSHYLRARPEGTLAGDALFRLCRLNVSEKRFGEARRCLSQYRRDYPGASRLSEVALIEAKIAKEVDEDCRAALPLLEQYLASRPSQGSEEAAFMRVDCLHTLASPALRERGAEFLTHYPHSKYVDKVRAWIAP